MNGINKVLIVGFGSAGRRHFELAQRLLPRAHIKVLRSTGVSENAKEIPIDIQLRTLADALEFAPDIAIIANPAVFHMRFAIPLANIGTHLLIEKPLATSIKEAKELLRIHDQKNAIVMCGYNLRYLSSLNHLRLLVQRESIGKVFSIRSEVGQRLQDWRPQVDYRTTVSAIRKLGGGVLFELSHEIDYLMWLFGAINWVFATLTTQSDLDIDVEDTAHILFGFNRKSNGHQIIANLTMDYIRSDPTRTCVITGELGTLKWDALNNTIHIYRSDKTGWELLFDAPKEDTYYAEWTCFLNAVTSMDASTNNGQEGLNVLKVIKSAQESSKKQRIVKV